MFSLDSLRSQIAALEAAGAAQADPNAWTEMIASYNALLAEIKTASDPAGPGGGKWTVAEIVGILPEFADLSQKLMALVASLLPKPSPTPPVDGSPTIG